MKPNDIVTNINRPADESGDEFMNWAKEVVRFMIPLWKEKPFEEPYNSQMASVIPVLGAKRMDLGNHIRIKSLARWLTDPGSSAMDYLPPFTVFGNHPEGYALNLDIEAARVSDLVFKREDQSNDPIPLGFEYYMNKATRKVYVRDGHSWKVYD